MERKKNLYLELKKRNGTLIDTKTFSATEMKVKVGHDVVTYYVVPTGESSYVNLEDNTSMYINDRHIITKTPISVCKVTYDNTDDVYENPNHMFVKVIEECFYKVHESLDFYYMFSVVDEPSADKSFVKYPSFTRTIYHNA